MASSSSSDSEKMFKQYLYDYMVRKGMLNAAAIFKEEANINVDIPIVSDCPKGFLHDWWCIFYDVHCARQLQPPESGQDAFSLAPETMPDNVSVDVLPLTPYQPLMSEQTPQLSETSFDFRTPMVQPACCPLPLPLQVYDEKPHPSLQLVNASPLQFPGGSSSDPIVISIEEQLQMLAMQNSKSGINLEGDVTRAPQDVVQKTIQPLSGPPGTSFYFQEFNCFRSSKSKLLSCHFSSEGNLLASAGHEKKILIWDMETFDCVTTSEDHASLITDVRFQPGSTVFATSSLDKTLNIWDAAKPNKLSFKLTGFSEQVMSVDFHPTRRNLFCTCDRSNTIQMWNNEEIVCTDTFQGGSKQVRFQPGSGTLLAAATRNTVNIFDVETRRLMLDLHGHTNDVLSVCWDSSGRYLVSVSQDSARVWNPSSDKNGICELPANGNSFQSCIFHPKYTPEHVIIGGYQTLDFWCPSQSCPTMSVSAHKGLIPGLAYSPRCDVIASASHDCCVKLWK